MAHLAKLPEWATGTQILVDYFNRLFLKGEKTYAIKFLETPG